MQYGPLPSAIRMKDRSTPLLMHSDPLAAFYGLTCATILSAIFWGTLIYLFLSC